ncbi:unnamed protein product, partial [Coregonus sp. 'balchen']
THTLKLCLPVVSFGRNWCQYTVSKIVSCQVHNGTETLVKRVFQSCRWPGPCSNLIRTLVRPTYRLTYRQVTALEWRCCPGFLGDDCKEGSPIETKNMALLPISDWSSVQHRTGDDPPLC